ncbi:unnamed protein product [Rhodiola kirilowii]
MISSIAAHLLVLNPIQSSLTLYRSIKTRFEVVLLRGGVFEVTPGRHKQRYVAVRCLSSVDVNGEAEPALARRSDANYTDCAWDYDYIQSSTRNEYLVLYASPSCIMHIFQALYINKLISFFFQGEGFKIQRDKMKQRVFDMLGCVSDRSEQLELINDLKRLGVAYHFEKEIKTILNKIYYTNYVFDESCADLHSTAFTCMLFRQHGYAVPQDVLKPFLDDTGKFKLSLCADIRGLISLYEASYLATEGEAIMDEARAFATANLSKINTADAYLDVLSARALDMPLHWRTDRSEARWFIEQAYEKKPNMSPLLLQFAKLDFNIVQAKYLEELRDLARWWKKLGFKKDLSFARDCLVVSYLWGIFASPYPQYETCRKALTKIIALISTVDDIYDIYGTLEEVELFTDAFHRWDINGMEQLPLYMKKCYLACFNCTNKIAYDVLFEKGSDVTSYVKKTWKILSSVFIKEARWFHSGYKPSLDEYMSDAWISVAVPISFIHVHLFDTSLLVEKQLQYLETNPDILKWSSIIVRLCDDLGTSPAEMMRGDTPKAIQCYMNDTGASEDAAREHVKTLVTEGWKKLNECVMEERILSATGVERLLNSVRAAHCFYQHGDGHGNQDGETKHLMSQLLFDPIPL